MSSSLSSSSSQSTNEGANQSTVYASATVTITAGFFQGSSYQSYGYITIGDQTFTIAGPTYMAALSDPHVAPDTWSFSAQRTYTHDANGYRGAVGVSASFSVDNASFHNSSSDTPDQGAIDYYRGPGTPSSVTATVNLNKTITVNSAAVSSPAGTPTYWFAYQANGGSWSAAESNGSSTSKVYTLPPGQNYAFRVYTTNSDGTSGTTTSSSVFLPSGGKIYNGTAWVPTTVAKIYNGTAWVDLSTAKIYNGTSWVNLT